MEPYNNTRQWVLKGHTPSELFQKEKKFLRPLPSEHFKVGQSNAKVIDLATRTKVGRNDLCPCSSSKKDKNAVGNNIVDMFLLNTHVECVVLMSRVKK
jgi:uncharacterized protein YecA (UPF0149 family)